MRDHFANRDAERKPVAAVPTIDYARPKPRRPPGLLRILASIIGSSFAFLFITWVTFTVFCRIGLSIAGAASTLVVSIVIVVCVSITVFASYLICVAILFEPNAIDDADGES